ncbi:MAG: type II toxin-antitoxin system HicB family antitoxin [Thermoanaerobacterales bacterium]|nr:type II toxin-antitoxin system HicB family antitoxin [Thermoanaerobacterales bacterium]
MKGITIWGHPQGNPRLPIGSRAESQGGRTPLKRRFKILLEWNEQGGYTVTVPTLPGCITEGDTIDEAVRNAREAVAGFLRALQKAGAPVPGNDSCSLS